MSAYFVFTREKTLDEQELAIYAKLVPATFAGHDMKLHAMYGAQVDVEGDPTEGTVILEFPSREAAMAWYDSPAYREVREHRFKGAVFHATLVEGV